MKDDKHFDAWATRLLVADDAERTRVLGSLPDDMLPPIARACRAREAFQLANRVENEYRDRLAEGASNRDLEDRLAEELADTFPAKTADFTTVGEGRKDDVDKVRMELVPPEMVFAVAEVLTFGAAKYDARNWEEGMSWGRVFGALMRHLWCWWGGKGPTTKSFLFGDLDDETGYSHLWHAGCCIAFLIAYEERGSGLDDRFKARASPETSE